MTLMLQMQQQQLAMQEQMTQMMAKLLPTTQSVESTPRQRIKPERPTIEADSTDNKWIIFKDAWTRYKQMAKLENVKTTYVMNYALHVAHRLTRCFSILLDRMHWTQPLKISSLNTSNLLQFGQFILKFTDSNFSQWNKVMERRSPASFLGSNHKLCYATLNVNATVLEPIVPHHILRIWSNLKPLLALTTHHTEPEY